MIQDRPLLTVADQYKVI